MGASGGCSLTQGLRRPSVACPHRLCGSVRATYEPVAHPSTHRCIPGSCSCALPSPLNLSPTQPFTVQTEFGMPGSPAFEAARNNFIASEAGYAIASFLLQVFVSCVCACVCVCEVGHAIASLLL